MTIPDLTSGMGPGNPPTWREQPTRTAAWLTIARYGNAALGVLSNALLARALGPASYGFVIAVISTNAAGVLMSEWSTEQFVIRAVSRKGTDLAASEIASAARLRLLIGPVPGLVLTGALIAWRAEAGTSEAIAGGLVWASSVLSFASLGPPALLAAGYTRAFVWITQVSGLLWSFGAIAVAVAHPTIIAAGATYGVSGLATGIAYLIVARRHGIHLAPHHSGLGGIRLLRELAPSATAQMSLLAPWRLVPPLIAALVAPVPAGLALAGLRFWEQMSIPAVALAQVQGRKVAQGEDREAAEVLRQVVVTVLAALVVGTPLAILYVRAVLGHDFRGLGTIVVGGAGMAVLAGVSQALVPVLLGGARVKEARRIGLGSLGLLVVLAAALSVADSAGSVLADVSMVMGCGLLLVVASTVRSWARLRPAAIAVLMAAVSAGAVVAITCG